MKKLLAVLLVFIMVCSMAACSSSDEITVVFADPLLERMVRAAINKPEGDITLTEAKAMTDLQLGVDWQPEPVPNSQITDISGLEYFVNLEDLNLSFHAITDITPLAELTKLKQLSLGGNPVADISPLSNFTNLEFLTLFNCQAQDYSPLANLTQLGGLLLEHSTIEEVGMLSDLTELWWLGLANTQVSDVSPLAGLTNLRQLQLAGCPITDYSPLADIYPNLESKDFAILPEPTSLIELGFYMNDERNQALFGNEQMDVRINHEEWGYSGDDSMQNCVRVVFGTDEYKVDIGYYPKHDTYVVLAYKNGEFVLNYLYLSADGSFSIGLDDNRENAEQHVRAFIPDAPDDEDILLAPINFHITAINDALGMTANELFALPFEPASLNSLGFIADEGNASYLYEAREPSFVTVEVHNPEWGNWESGGEVRFFMPLSDEYRIVVTYIIDEKRFIVGADDNYGGGAEYSYLIDSDEHTDIWCSDSDMTVEEYFRKAINDPSFTDPTDIYQFSVKQMIRTVETTFGMSIDELYALIKE